MDELESQVAKIQIGNPKAASSYVLVVAEKAPVGNAELYVIAELPLLNPAAQDSCERICMAIVAALRRAYKKPLTPASFENAVAQINDELGKSASLGQTHWIDKLACIVAVKEGTTFHITTCGKVAAFLYRGNEFTDISCSPEQSHPLKTFENLASGKIRLGDMLLLSTTQLFNYLAMERLKDIVNRNPFLIASQTILEILKENAGPDVAFGTILNLQVAPGETGSDEIDLEEYVANTSSGVAQTFAKIGSALGSLLPSSKPRQPKTELPKISVPSQVKDAVGPTVSAVARKNRFKNFSLAAVKDSLVKTLETGVAWVKWTLRKFNLSNYRNFSPEKKFFLFSIVVLLVSVVITVGVAKRVEVRKRNQQQAALVLSEVSNLLDKTQNSLLYRDDTSAKTFLTQAVAKMPAFADIPESSQDKYHELEKTLEDLKSKMDKTTEAKVSSLGNLGSGDTLVKLPQYIGLQINGNIVSFNKSNSLIQDGTLKSSEIISLSTAISDSQAVIYNGTSLLVWDFGKGTVGASFSQSVPGKNDTAGLAWYPTSSRVYMVNKRTNQILSYLVNGGSVSKPVVWSRDANNLSSALDMAIDGSIYVLNTNGITKYHGGSLTEFNFPQLYTRFSGQGKIYTDKDARNLYVLDAGNNRILILSKTGSLISSLVSKQFTQLKDFQVDEKNKTIWVLNGGTLLKVAIP